MAIVSTSLGSSTTTGWKRLQAGKRQRAALGMLTAGARQRQSGAVRRAPTEFLRHCTGALPRQGCIGTQPDPTPGHSRSPLQRRVALDVLAVLVQRGGADALQLAARQGGLEQVGNVHAAAAAAAAAAHRARAHQRVHLPGAGWGGVGRGGGVDGMRCSMVRLWKHVRVQEASQLPGMPAVHFLSHPSPSHHPMGSIPASPTSPAIPPPRSPAAAPCHPPAAAPRRS